MPKAKIPFYKKIWFKVVAVTTVLATFLGLLSDGLGIFDRFFPKNIIEQTFFTIRPKNINYDIDRSAYEVEEEVDLKIETANFLGTIDDSIKIEKIVCLSNEFIESKRNFPTDFQISSIDIENKVLSPSDPKSNIKMKVKFYIFFNLSFAYFYNYDNSVHVFDVYIDIPVTSEGQTEIKKTIVPVFISK